MNTEGVLLSVLTPQGELIDDSANRVQQWQGELPADGEHIIQLRPVEGLESSDYELAVSLSEASEETPEPEPEPSPEETDPPDEVTPEPEPEPEPAPEANIIEQRVQFPPNGTTVQVADQVDETRIRRYCGQLTGGANPVGYPA